MGFALTAPVPLALLSALVVLVLAALPLHLQAVLSLTPPRCDCGSMSAEPVPSKPLWQGNAWSFVPEMSSTEMPAYYVHNGTSGTTRRYVCRFCPVLQQQQHRVFRSKCASLHIYIYIYIYIYISFEQVLYKLMLYHCNIDFTSTRLICFGTFVVYVRLVYSGTP